MTQAAATGNVRPRATVVCFSKIESDGRVLRQIKCLAQDFDVTVIGYGSADTALPGGARLLPVPAPASFLRRNLTAVPKLALAKLAPDLGYGRWYWDRLDHDGARTLATASSPDLIVANDWTALPAAAEAASAAGSKLVLDLHEYGPEQLAGRRAWMLLIAPMIVHYLRRYGARADACITVSQTIAERYERELGLRCAVITNAPELTHEPPFRPTRPDDIRLVHHGAPIHDRKLEVLVEAVGLMRPSFSLTFLFTDREPRYVRQLKALAQRVAPGRVRFERAVPPDRIVPTIAVYDVGIHVLPPVSFNHDAALPNKLFDFICAGLAVCIGPSPEMARLVREHGVGVVADGFEARALARAMNALDAAALDAMKQRSVAIRRALSGEAQMRSLRAICRDVAGLSKTNLT